MKKIILLFLLVGFNAFGQDYFKKYDSLSKLPDVDLKKMTDSLLYLSNSAREYNNSAKIAHSYSVKMYITRSYNEAILYGEEEIKALGLGNEKDKTYTRALYNTGIFYRFNHQYNQSINYLEKVIELNNDNQKIAQSYGGIGKNHYYKGEYLKAISFFQKSIKLLEGISDYRSLYTQYLALAHVYLRLKDKSEIKKGLNIIAKINELKSRINFSKQMKVNVNSISANLYNTLDGEYLEKTKKYYLDNISLIKEINDSIELGRNYSNLSHVYNLQKNDSASYYVLKGIPLLKSNISSLTVAYNNYIEHLLINKKYILAINEVNKVLKLNFSREGDLFKLNDFELYNVINKRSVLICLKRKSQALIALYIKTNDNLFLQRAIRAVKVYNELVLFITKNSSQDLTKLFWRREASQAYLYGAYAAHLLGDEEQAFSFMEKNKVLLLSESILKNTEFANLPKNVSDEETRLQKMMYELENKLSKKEDDGILQDSLFNAKRQHEKYVDSLRVVYPKYFDRKVDVAQISLSEVQKELKEDQVLVSYIWNKFDEDKELLIGLATSKEKTITFEINQTDSLKKKIARYRALISQPQNIKKGQEAYQEVAYELYQELFPSQEIQNLIKGKNLLIIPDGGLQNIPFEALITKENSNDYLILNGDVNYSYSYSFLKHNDKVKRETSQSFIGYSPVSFKEEGLSSLNDSEKEVEIITDELGGVSKVKKEASKKDFLAQSSQSKIIHLATHADAGENPWIAFSDAKLELHELYTYKNNAELVTLSACNTSLGEMAKGEGVLSLARGFFHSGSKSVVSSLWNVNDTSTSDIMTDFYKNLKEGQTKSEALNNAKRAYLTTHELSAQSPYYWSSFVLIGDAEAIYSSNNYLYVIVGIAIFVLLVLLVRKRKLRV